MKVITIKVENLIYIFVILFIVLSALFNQCTASENKPVIVDTKVNIQQVIDSVKRATLKDVKTVYIDTSKTDIKYVKGKTIYKDSIIYVDKPNDNTITANQYQTKIESNNAFADLNITTTGELLDVKGNITYPEKETTTTITNTVNDSGFFLYGQMPVNNIESPEIGIMYQHKNKLILGGGIQINTLNNEPNYTLTLGIKL